MIEKRKIYKKYNKFVSVQNIGLYWVGQIKQFAPYSYFIQEIGFTQVAAWGLHSISWGIVHNPTIPFYAIVIFVISKYYIFMIVNWIAGWAVILSGLQKAQADINAKDAHLNPYDVEQRKTIENIARAVGAKSEYTQL